VHISATFIAANTTRRFQTQRLLKLARSNSALIIIIVGAVQQGSSITFGRWPKAQKIGMVAGHRLVTKLKKTEFTVKPQSHRVFS